MRGACEVKGLYLMSGSIKDSRGMKVPAVSARSILKVLPARGFESMGNGDVCMKGVVLVHFPIADRRCRARLNGFG